MLVIRDAQIQSFIANNDEDLVRIICEAVIKANQRRVASIRPLRLIAMVKLGVEQAKAMEITRPEDIASFVALMFEISPAFYKQEAIAAILADESLSIGDRFSELPKRAPDSAWAAAQAAYDEKVWFPEAAPEAT